MYDHHVLYCRRASAIRYIIYKTYKLLKYIAPHHSAAGGENMEAYRHAVQYYETDKMGITHHSNYIRWMEEARIDFLRQIGWSYARLEEEGIVSPVIEVNCKYRKSTTFGDTVFIDVSVGEFKGLKLILRYEMKTEDGTVVAEAESVHCFLDESGRPMRLAKQFPELSETLISLQKA